jgi:hypothetical protein
MLPSTEYSIHVKCSSFLIPGHEWPIFDPIPFHKLACQFEPATGLSFCLTDVVRERLREEECWFSRKTRTSGGRPSRQNEEDDGRSELGVLIYRKLSEFT